MPRYGKQFYKIMFNHTTSKSVPIISTIELKISSLHFSVPITVYNLSLLFSQQPITDPNYKKQPNDFRYPIAKSILFNNRLPKLSQFISL